MTAKACAAGVGLLMDYLETALPASTVAAIDGHVAGCDRCQAFLASYLATPYVIRTATDVALPPTVQASMAAWLRRRRGE